MGTLRICNVRPTDSIRVVNPISNYVYYAQDRIQGDELCIPNLLEDTSPNIIHVDIPVCVDVVSVHVINFDMEGFSANVQIASSGVTSLHVTRIADRHYFTASDSSCPEMLALAERLARFGSG